MGQTLVVGIISGGIYGLMAVGLVLVFKGTRVLNFAQVEVGTQMGWPPGPAVVVKTAILGAA